MTAAHDTAVSWVASGTTTSVDALVLRFGAVLNGLFDRVVEDGNDWLLVDHSGHVIDCSANDGGATALLGSPITNIAGGVAAESFATAWSQVLMGRAQAVWPWQGGRARAAMRSIEIHPIRDTLSDGSPVVGALAVIVDAGVRIETMRLAA